MDRGVGGTVRCIGERDAWKLNPSGLGNSSRQRCTTFTSNASPDCEWSTEQSIRIIQDCQSFRVKENRPRGVGGRRRASSMDWIVCGTVRLFTSRRPALHDGATHACHSENKYPAWTGVVTEPYDAELRQALLLEAKLCSAG
jgi:hypothetical protein